MQNFNNKHPLITIISSSILLGLSLISSMLLLIITLIKFSRTTNYAMITSLALILATLFIYSSFEIVSISLKLTGAAKVMDIISSCLLYLYTTTIYIAVFIGFHLSVLGWIGFGLSLALLVFNVLFTCLCYHQQKILFSVTNILFFIYSLLSLLNLKISTLSTILSIIGISLGDWKESNWITRSLVVIIIFAIILVLVYFVIGRIFKKSVNLIIGQTPVSIEAGNIFEAKGLRVIGCDTHFDTRVDDIVIAKNSLHGQLFLQHGELKEIQSAIKAEAKRLNLSENTEGLYDFPLGTIICYNRTRNK